MSIENCYQKGIFLDDLYIFKQFIRLEASLPDAKVVTILLEAPGTFVIYCLFLSSPLLALFVASQGPLSLRHEAM